MLNSFEVHPDQLFGNAEIHDISVAIGVDPHSADDSPDLSGLRYGKIAILSDAEWTARTSRFCCSPCFTAIPQTRC